MASVSYKKAKQLSKDWHGRENLTEVDLETSKAYRGNLADLGELEELQIATEYGKTLQDVTKYYEIFFDPKDRPTLAGYGNNLFIEGGYQELPRQTLEDLVLDEEELDKDLLDLGEIYAIAYTADKHHLDGSSGKKESYLHRFMEFKPNPDSDEIQYPVGKMPRLQYDQLNKTLKIVGGTFKIQDVGING